MIKPVFSSATVLVALFLLTSCRPGDRPEPMPAPAAVQTVGSIERLDPRMDALVPQDAALEVLAEGYDWSEGPVWVPELNALLFSDIPPNAIHIWNESDGASLWLTPSGYTGETPRGGEPGSNGLLLDAEGRLVLCQHGDRRIARLDAPLTDPAPTFTPIAETWDGKRFNSPNDAVYHSSGALYFTDPPYGLEQRMDDPAKEIPFQGVYRVDPDGTVTLLTDELSRPNGIAFSPDEQTLYVANSDPERPIWMAFDVRADGTLANSRVFFDASELAEERQGMPDGLKVDTQGNLFATGPGGVLVLAPDGTHLGTFLTGQATANCAFGNDGSTLYMTADGYLLRTQLTTTGEGF